MVAYLVSSFASVALVKIPLSPANVAMVTPAKINNTIMEPQINM